MTDMLQTTLLSLALASQTVIQLPDGWYIVPADQRLESQKAGVRLSRVEDYRYVEPLRGIRVDSDQINNAAPIIMVVPLGAGKDQPESADLEQLRRLPTIYRNFTVEGHADATGSSIGNQRLSLKRAQKIARVLIEAGAREVQVRAYGANQPVCRDNNTECQARNRRVVIRAQRIEQ